MGSQSNKTAEEQLPLGCRMFNIQYNRPRSQLFFDHLLRRISIPLFLLSYIVFGLFLRGFLLRGFRGFITHDLGTSNLCPSAEGT